jgi:hypothetical protein
VALSAGFVIAPASGVSRDDAAALTNLAGSLVVAAQRLGALETPANLGHGARMVFVGDSLGGDVARGLIPVATARGARVVLKTVPGCSTIAGLPLTHDGTLIPWGPTCLDNLLGSWPAEVAATPADAVVWLSSFDGASRMIDGVLADTATPEGRARIAALTIEMSDAIAPPGSGRRVVLLLPAPDAPSPLHGEPDRRSAIDVERHRAILHLVVESDPTRFSMLKLDQFLCPRGVPCPAEPVPGIAPRGADGGHITPEGAAWLAPQVLDALGVT